MTDAPGLTGVAVAVGSALLYDLGYVLEKRALDSLGPDGAEAGLSAMLRRAVTQPMWLSGFAAMVAGLGLQVLALSVAPVSLVQPVLAGGLVALAAVGPRLLGERLTARETCALVAVLASVAAAAISSRGGSTLPQRIPPGRFAVAAALLMATAALVWRSGRRTSHGGLVGTAVPAGLLYGLGAVAEKAVATRIHDSGLSRGAVASLGTAYPWMFVVVTAAGLICFQAGLARQPASLMASLTNLVATGAALTGAAAVFSDPLLPHGAWALARLGALAGVVAALALLAAPRPAGVAAR